MQLFRSHPNAVGETYREHMRMSFSFAAELLLAGSAAFIHGIFPFIFERTGSKTVTRLYGRMVTNRTISKAAGSEVQPQSGDFTA